MSGRSLGGLAIDIGDVLLGRYRVESVIAEGGTGIVLAAHDLTRKAEVAIKLLRRGLDTEELRTRFGREARATAQLSSPHVVRVFDAGALADGSPYMVMERLEGRDLARVLREDGRLPVAEAVDCMLQVCEVLREAHGRGIVHRDLKPANLVLTRRVPAEGGVDVKVLDFGISKIVTSANAAQNQADTHQEVTVPFTILGSPRYMAPEQVRNSKDVDCRADLWSVGAVLFQLVTGDHAFAAEGAVQASVAVLTAEPRDLQELAPHAPFGLADVIKRCLAKDVEHRWQTAGDLVAALRPFGSRVGRSTAPIPPLPVPVPVPVPVPEVSTPPSLRSLVEVTGPPPPPISERTRTERMAPVTPDQFARVSVTGPAWGRSQAPPAPARPSRLFLGTVCAGLLFVAGAGVLVTRVPSSVRVSGARATGQAFEPHSAAPAPAASVVLDAGTPSP